MICCIFHYNFPHVIGNYTIKARVVQMPAALKIAAYVHEGSITNILIDIRVVTRCDWNMGGGSKEINYVYARPCWPGQQ
jgi:hypothetical protein